MGITGGVGIGRLSSFGSSFGLTGGGTLSDGLSDDMFEQALSAEVWQSSDASAVAAPKAEADQQLSVLSEAVAEHNVSVPFDLSVLSSATTEALFETESTPTGTDPGPWTPLVWRPERPGDFFLVLDGRCASSYTEQFQLLRTQLLLARSQSPAGERLKCLCVTSALGGEGKSFTARNLAATLAKTGTRQVLLLQTGVRDLPIPPEALSLDQLLAHPTGWRQGAVQLDGVGLTVMGGVPPGTKVDYEPLPALLNELRPHFDWILMDGPAVLRSPAAEWLAAAADATLMVVRQGDTPFDRVAEAMQRIPQAMLAGVVMNRMAPKPRRSWLPKIRIRLKKNVA